MSDVVAAPRKRGGPSPALFLYGAACAILLFGIIAAAGINSATSCEGPYYPSGDTCVSYAMGNESIIGSTPAPSTQAPTKDSKLDVRAEIILATLTVSLIVASYGARAHRRERAVVPVEPAGES